MTSLHVPVRVAHLIADGKVRYTRLRPSERDIQPWRRGGSYAVIPTGRPALCRIVLESIDPIAAGEHVAAHELRAEGYKTIADLARQWMRSSKIDEVTDADLARIFERRHAQLPAVRLGFRLDTTHRPRLQHAQRIGAYTEDPAEAALGEPEAVPEFVTDRQADDADERRVTGVGENERRVLAELVACDGRLARLLDASTATSDETRSAVRVIRQRIASLEQHHGRVA